MPKQKTRAQLQAIIDGKNADIKALYKQIENNNEQTEKIADQLNKTTNEYAKFETEAANREEGLRCEIAAMKVRHENESSEFEKKLAAAEKREAVLEAKVAQLWRAFEHTTNAFAAHK